MRLRLCLPAVRDDGFNDRVNAIRPQVVQQVIQHIPAKRAAGKKSKCIQTLTHKLHELLLEDESAASASKSGRRENEQ